MYAVFRDTSMYYLEAKSLISFLKILNCSSRSGVGAEELNMIYYVFEFYFHFLESYLRPHTIEVKGHFFNFWNYKIIAISFPQTLRQVQIYLQCLAEDSRIIIIIICFVIPVMNLDFGQNSIRQQSTYKIVQVTNQCKHEKHIHYLVSFLY